MKNNAFSTWFGLSRDSKNAGTPLSVALPTNQKIIITIALGCLCVLLFAFTQHVDGKVLGALLAISVFINALALLGQMTINQPEKTASTEY